jgi:hypothetical protein
MSTKIQQVFIVHGGPSSASRLVQCLLHAYATITYVPIFKVTSVTDPGPFEIKLTIIGLEHTDCSGESFHIIGVDAAGIRYKGNYDCSSQSGRLTRL